MTSEEYLRRLVDDWPPLTPGQRDSLRVLLRTDSRREKRTVKAA
ncbi:hypothetical protein RI578_06805 [Streptomyces sp. BB1-1-1]|nr:hypothetical protein [Streptomyces sp. BB1-1-1]WND34023.1 hypothetical protein RI578_06805 [Streptomyces sp. BB1-1-1]